MDNHLYEPLRQHLRARIVFSAAEEDAFISGFSVKRVKKKQYLVQPGFVAKQRFYVIKGAFRSFITDDEGVDRTIQFAIEDWWISDYNSYVQQTPATMIVEALEDSIVLAIDYEREEALKKAGHHFETFFRIMAERATAFMQRRIVSSLTQSAEERYHQFLERYPLVAQRLPQYAIASYLGMTTEFLSKIRNHKVKRKS